MIASINLKSLILALQNVKYLNRQIASLNTLFYNRTTKAIKMEDAKVQKL